ncbi:ABC transporter F family member 4-like [Siniperca chuatsi]|uniref:ABC transporter F family member 4-like n=1 Tax=Siniperca chuatsi TaxID=119488 RepID=UPI001CE1D8D7|nr:ABC transporter F family member 4-like [Siniperca chuatsi]
MSKSMCGCGCSIISSLMKRLGRTACCSDLFSSHTSEQLQRLATGCPPQPKNAKPFSSSDSLAKVQEVASWLLEMNQDLLSGGSSSRRSRGPGGPAVRGNASSTARAPQQAAEEGDEDEHMNRVVEEEEQLQQRLEASQVDGEREQPWAASESGASNGPRGDEEGEEDEEGPPNEVNGGEKGARWMWGAEQRRPRDQPLGEEDEEEEEEEENNNSSSHQEEEEAEERTEGGEEQGREEEEREEGEEEEEEDEDEEEMDQDSDDFEHSAESGREEEEEEEGEGEEVLRSPSLRNNVSAPSNNLDSGCTHQSSSNKKVSSCCLLNSFHWNSCTFS